MKKTITIFILALFAMAGPARADYDFFAVATTGQTLYYKITSSSAPYTAKVTYPGSEYLNGYNGFDKPVGGIAIPSSVINSSNGITYTVTSIEMFAFAHCNGITSVSIPNMVTSIGAGAFLDCNGLASINIPNTVTSIGNGAFNYCSSLTTIDIPASVTTIGSMVFSNANALTAINVHSDNQSYSSVDGVLFDKNENTLIHYPNAKLGDNYNIPNSVTTIDFCAFDRCVNLTSITVDANHEHFSSIDGVLFNKDTTKIIKYLPSRSDSSYTIPNGVTEIITYAFHHCGRLNSITIPSTVNTFGTPSFWDCINLIEIWMLGTTKPQLMSFGEGLYRIYVPFGSKTSYGTGTEGILYDGTAYGNTTEMSDAKVRYTRTFSSDNWVPLFVPFTSLASEWINAGFTIAELSSVTYENDGTNDYDVMHWDLVTTGIIEANHPYIIRHNSSESYDFDHIFSGCSVATCNLTDANKTICDNTLNTSEGYARRYTLTGTYVLKDYEDGSVWYAMGGGNFWPAQSGNHLLPQRFFLTITDPETGAPKSAPQGGTILRVGEDNVGIIRPDATIMLPVDDNYYDLLGRRVDQPQKGHIYIHNHKKIIY